MTSPSTLPPGVVRWVIGLVAFVALTNRYTNPVRDAAELRARVPDSFSYLAMSEAAPRLPAEPIRFQRAQRIAVPYVVGVVSKTTGTSPHAVNLAVVFVASLIVTFLLMRLLARERLTSSQTTLVVAVALLNPWSFRWYFAYPELIDDPVFVLGLSLVIVGVVEGRGAMLLIGQLIASLARQTGLLLLPMIVFSLWRDRDRWRALGSTHRALLGASAVGIAGAVYFWTGSIAASFATPDRNAALAFGLFSWVTHSFDAMELARFILSMVLPLVIPLAVLLLSSRRLWREPLVQALALGALCIWAQPFLSGPKAAAGAGPRLVTIGILPVLVVAGLALRESGAFADDRSQRTVPAMVSAMALASLQHLVVAGFIPLAGQRGAAILLYTLAATAVVVLCVGERRRVSAVHA